MMAFDKVCFPVSNRGTDPRGLGRFTWMEFNGLGGVKRQRTVQLSVCCLEVSFLSI